MQVRGRGGQAAFAGSSRRLPSCVTEERRFLSSEKQGIKGESGEGKEEDKRQQMTSHLAQRNQDVKTNIIQVTKGRDKIL